MTDDTGPDGRGDGHETGTVERLPPRSGSTRTRAATGSRHPPAGQSSVGTAVDRIGASILDATVRRPSVTRVPTRLHALVSELNRELRNQDTQPVSTVEHLDAAIHWLYRSQDATNTGGSASAYNLILGWGGPYPETTGYIIPTLYDYAEFRESTEARVRAERMARWLLDVQFDDGSFPAGDNPARETDPSIFNTGQILFGLVRAYQETGDSRFWDAARQAGRWLISVQHPDGYWDRYDYNDTIHSYSSRVAWALLEAAECTGIESFRTAARSNLEWVADQQRANGWFANAEFDRGEDPYLHTLAYTIRGLLEGGLLLDDSDLVDRARASADAFLDLQTRTGILRGQYDEQLNGPSYYCLTGNAQMAIVWYRLFETTGDDTYRRGADRTVQFLKRKQRMSGPPQVRGGLSGSDPVWQRYMYLRYPNWAAKFLADALLLSEAAADDPERRQ